MSFEFKTRSQQQLEYLESLKRPLTDEESEQLQRSMHAVYEYKRSKSRLAQHRREELDVLSKVEAEAREPEWYPHG